MSLPQVRKRLLSLRPTNMKRRKFSQETVSSSSSSQPHQDATIPAATQPASSSVKGQTTATVVTHGTSPDEPPQKKDTVPQWLEKQAQRLKRLRRGSTWYRDSMFDSQDVKQELKQAAEEVNATVSGPHSEPVPQRMIDHFFTLYPAGGSDWKNSVRWECHVAKCAARKCAICKATQVPSGKPRSQARSPAKPPTRLPASPPASPPTRPSTYSPSELPKGSYFTIPLWQSKSDKRRQKRGKSPAQDDMYDYLSGLDDGEPISPRTQIPRYLETPFSRMIRQSRPGVVIYDSNARFEQRVPPPPVRCSSVSKPVDASKIPVPAMPDLRAPSSETINVRDLSHVTGRPYEICPLELLHFPLSQHYNLPSTPQLRPERGNAPIPEMEQLTDTSRVSSDASLPSNISPVPTVGPTATNVQRWPTQPPSTLHDAPTPSTVADMLSQDGGLEMPNRRKRRVAVASNTYRTPAPSTQYPPTPPDSRHTSNAWHPGSPHTSYSSEASPERVATPEGPADRDWATCVLSDTTGSSFPNCPTYVNARERLDKYWAGFAERHGPGMRNWR